jgi:hypothetical protein
MVLNEKNREKKYKKNREKKDEKCEKKNKNEMVKYSVGRFRNENKLRNMVRVLKRIEVGVGQCRIVKNGNIIDFESIWRK